MHVLGHSFSQRRKSPSKRPRDLHIRKVSFSGCSLSSGCSISSASSTSTTRTHLPRSASNSSGTFDPLSLHPTFHAPPRLHERPLIHSDPVRHDEPVPATFFDDETDDAEDEDDEELMRRQEQHQQHYQQPLDMALPPHVSPSDYSNLEERQEPQDYFFMTLAKRPPMPRSHWSESTIHTIHTSDQLTPGALVDDEDEDDDVAEDVRPSLLAQTMSYKRSTHPKRPPMKGDDSVENFIKRGGWKRRGIVFHSEEMNPREE